MHNMKSIMQQYTTLIGSYMCMIPLTYMCIIILYLNTLIIMHIIRRVYYPTIHYMSR